MEKITHEELLIIYQGALEMARVDRQLTAREKEFLAELVELGRITQDEITLMEAALERDIFSLAKNLSSNLAKKTFLLTIATMAIADKKLHPKEKKLLINLTKQLNVGKVRLAGLSFQSSERMVLKLLSKVEVVNPDMEPEQQYSDLDFLR